MAARGPYAKGVAKRAEILDVALEVIARDGYSGATVAQLAEAVGLSQNGLLHYFGSKDALFVEILRHQDEVISLRIDPEHTDFAANLTERILAAISDSLDEPGMSQLLIRLSVEASEADHPAHDFIRERYTAFRRVIATALTTLQERGELAASADPHHLAYLIASTFDGLQLQWLHDRSIDVRLLMRELLASLGLPADSTG